MPSRTPHTHPHTSTHKHPPRHPPAQAMSSQEAAIRQVEDARLQAGALQLEGQQLAERLRRCEQLCSCGASRGGVGSGGSPLRLGAASAPFAPRHLGTRAEQEHDKEPSGCAGGCCFFLLKTSTAFPPPSVCVSAHTHTHAHSAPYHRLPITHIVTQFQCAAAAAQTARPDEAAAVCGRTRAAAASRALPMQGLGAWGINHEPWCGAFLLLLTTSCLSSPSPAGCGSLCFE